MIHNVNRHSFSTRCSPALLSPFSPPQIYANEYIDFIYLLIIPFHQHFRCAVVATHTFAGTKFDKYVLSQFICNAALTMLRCINAHPSIRNNCRQCSEAKRKKHIEFLCFNANRIRAIILRKLMGTIEISTSIVQRVVALCDQGSANSLKSIAATA